MNYKRRTINGFTLIELVVAIGILAMMLVFASVIFKVSIGAHRTSGANAEIMQKLRAITDQLNTDFKGLRKDAPLLIWFEQGPDGQDDPNRFDQIMFFADGDFQSTQVYENSGIDRVPAYPPDKDDKPIRGNTARIFYGQAQSRDSRDDEMEDQPSELKQEDRILARRRHILTAEKLDPWPDPESVGASFVEEHDGRYKNEHFEHNRLSLAEWKTVKGSEYGNILKICFKDFRPWVDTDDEKTLHKLMCEGVGSFAIQFASWKSNKLYWLPENSNFGSQESVYFKIPGSIAGWDTEGDLFDGVNITYPQALKFTFTLYDSKGILEGGREFTHIVYLGD